MDIDMDIDTDIDIDININIDIDIDINVPGGITSYKPRNKCSTCFCTLLNMRFERRSWRYSSLLEFVTEMFAPPGFSSITWCGLVLDI